MPSSTPITFEPDTSTTRPIFEWGHSWRFSRNKIDKGFETPQLGIENCRRCFMVKSVSHEMPGFPAADEGTKSMVTALAERAKAFVLLRAVDLRAYECYDGEVTVSRVYRIADGFVYMLVVEAVAKDDETIFHA